jgi:RimJ/RimL family protein N-acetyltransferase
VQPLPYETLAADGILLRPPHAGDAGDLTAGWSDPMVARFIPSLPRAEGVDAWIANVPTAPDRRDLIIADPVTDRVLGGCGLYRMSTVDSSGELGYWVAPWARGNRLAARASTLLTGWALAHGMGRLEALVRPDNPASQRVALGAGYRHEGRRRGYSLDRDGTRRDLTAWVRLATDPSGPAPRAIPDLPGGRLGDGVVELRPLGPEDTGAVGELRDLPEVRATSFGSTDVVRVCAEAAYQWLSGVSARMTIRDAGTGALAGEIGLFHVEPSTGQGMIGYDLLPAFRGKGFATRAVRLLADWAFGTAGLARLIAGTTPDNLASQAVLERAGFSREGYQRARLPGPDGGRMDDVLYALLS